jgi:hypothetical protein
MMDALYEGLALQVDDLAKRLHDLTMKLNKEPTMSTMLQHDEPNEYEKATTARTVHLSVDVSDTALRRVRAGFNPDHLTEVGHLHLLAAAFITACERMRDREKPILPSRDQAENVPASTMWSAIDEGARNAAIAITESETACMHAVKAATAVIYASKNVRRGTQAA